MTTKARTKEEYLEELRLAKIDQLKQSVEEDSQLLKNLEKGDTSSIQIKPEDQIWWDQLQVGVAISSPTYDNYAVWVVKQKIAHTLEMMSVHTKELRVTTKEEFDQHEWSVPLVY